MRCFSTRAMKSRGAKRARADFAKCGLAERKCSLRQWRFVKLHRPPPEMRIFFPGRSERSRTATRRPRLAAWAAQKSPAAPAPRTITSNRPPIAGSIVAGNLAKKDGRMVGKRREDREKGTGRWKGAGRRGHG